jgi:hypothetical protein
MAAPPPVPQRRQNDRVETFREHAERTQIAVVVVIVAQQHGRDRWKVDFFHAKGVDRERINDLLRAAGQSAPSF